MDNVQLWRDLMTAAVVLLSAVLWALARRISPGGLIGGAPRDQSGSHSAEPAREIGRLWRSLQRCRREVERLRSAGGKRGTTR